MNPSNASSDGQRSLWRTLRRLLIVLLGAASSYALIMWVFYVLSQNYAPGTVIGDVSGYGLAIMSYLGFGVVLFPVWVWVCYWLMKTLLDRGGKEPAR